MARPYSIPIIHVLDKQSGNETSTEGQLGSGMHGDDVAIKFKQLCTCIPVQF